MFKVPTFMKLRFKKLHLKRLKRVNATDVVQTANFNQLKYLFFIRFTISRLITDKQISCVRKMLLKKTFRLLHITYKQYPTTMITAKPPEMRMGKGKGSLQDWVVSNIGGSLFCIVLFSPLQAQFLCYDMLYALRYRVYTGLIFDCRL